eukprot:SAG11_NODE_725_length_7518_cov_3.706025_3_plen_365_part_00
MRHSRSADMTEHASDYAAEVLGEYILLAIHANIQVDMLDEEMVLEPENLVPLKLLVITQPNVPDSAMVAVEAWVRGGGTLLTTSGAATADRLNDSSKILRNLTGIVEKPRPRLNINYATDPNYCCCPPCTGTAAAPTTVLRPGDRAFPTAATGTISWPGNCAAGGGSCRASDAPLVGSFNAVGIRSETEPKNERADASMTTLGTFSDGSAAVLRATVAKGATVHFNFLPGLSYIPNATNWGRLALPSEFPTTLRDALVAAATDAGVKPVVRCSEAFVETPLLLSQEGAVLTLLNWGDTVFSATSPLLLNITLPFEPKRVESVEGVENGPAPVKFQVLSRGNDEVVVSTQLPLAAASFLLLWRGG